MPFCNRCGKEIGPSMQFCPYCGTKVAVPAPPVLQTPTVAKPPPPYVLPPPPAGVLHPHAQPPVKPAPPREKVHTQPVIGMLGIAAMAVVVAASFLPWAAWHGFSKSGWSGDGQITFATGIFAVLFFVVAALTRVRWPYVICLLVSLLTAAVFVIDLVDVIDTAGLASVGYGLFMGMAGACLAVLFSILGLTVIMK